MMTHPQFQTKLEAVGFGGFIPFFVTCGMEMDLRGGVASLAPVPVFLLALLLVRGLPAALYRSSLGTRWLRGYSNSSRTLPCASAGGRTPSRAAMVGATSTSRASLETAPVLTPAPEIRSGTRISRVLP